MKKYLLSSIALIACTCNFGQVLATDYLTDNIASYIQLIHTKIGMENLNIKYDKTYLNEHKLITIFQDINELLNDASNMINKHLKARRIVLTEVSEIFKIIKELNILSNNLNILIKNTNININLPKEIIMQLSVSLKKLLDDIRFKYTALYSESNIFDDKTLEVVRILGIEAEKIQDIIRSVNN